MDKVRETVTTKMLAEQNRARVLHLLYTEKQLTRRAIGDELNLSAPTVSKIVDSLIEEGLITEGVALQSSGGRKPRTLSFVPLSHYSVGVEIALHRIRFVIVDLWGSIYTTKSFQIEFEASERYLRTVSQTINTFIDRSQIDEKQILGIGIAICGIVHGDSLIVEYSSTLNVRNWDISLLGEELRFPIMLINDAYAAGCIEIRNSTRMNKMFYLSLSEGISGALLIDNEVFTGYNNRAGAIGSMLIPAIGRDANASPLQNSFETNCSSTVLTKAFDESLEVFFLMLKKKEPRHVELWDTYLQNLAIAISNIRNLVDVAIVLGGTLGPYLDDHVDRLLDLTMQHSPFQEKAIFIRVAYHANNAASVGAAMQFVNRFLDF